MKNKLIYSLLAASILTACGGSSGKTTKPTEPPENTAPVAANDEALVQNNNTTSIDVLTNDTDGDGDTLTITAVTAEPAHGSVEITDNTLVYTPEENFAGTDTISYQISDGALTSEASVAIVINHTMTLTGKVTDGPIANAEVRVTMGQDNFVTTADAEGKYQLAIEVNDMNAVLKINAKGHADNGQENVELVSLAGGVKELLAKVNEERILGSDTDKATNVTHVSTASYLLAKDRNEEQEIDSAERLGKLTSQVSSHELLNTAGFIKLLIDHDDFAIPEGKTTISTLESMTDAEAGDEVATSAAILAYLNDNNLVDENGEPTTVFSEAIEAAIAATIADPDATDSFTIGMLSGKKLLQLEGARQGWHEQNAAGLVFNADGTASYFSPGFSGYQTSATQANWTVSEGRLELIYSEESRKSSYPNFYYPYERLVTDYGFDSSVKDALVSATDAGLISYSLQLEITDGYSRQSMILMNKTDKVYQANVSGTYVYTLVMPEAVNWSGENPTASEEREFNANLAHGYTSLFTDNTIEELAGDWLLNIDYGLKSYFDSSSPLLFGRNSDKFSLSAAGATGMLSGLEFNTKMEDNALVLSSGTTVYKITPIIQSGKSYLVSTEKWVDGTLEYVIGNTMAQFDDSYATFTDNLVTELPEVYLAHINSHLINAWDGDKLKLDYIWGYQFNASGVLNRGISGFNYGEDNWDGIEEDHFYLGDNRWTWDSADNIVNLYFEDDWRVRHRTWDVISIDEQGYALVLEYSTYGSDDNNDGKIGDDEIGYFIFPRLNIQKKEDLSQWQEAWQNTVDAGLVSGSVDPSLEGEQLTPAQFKTKGQKLN